VPSYKNHGHYGCVRMTAHHWTYGPIDLNYPESEYVSLSQGVVAYQNVELLDVNSKIRYEQVVKERAAAADAFSKAVDDQALSKEKVTNADRVAGDLAYSRGERTISVSLRHLSGRTEEVACAPCTSCFDSRAATDGQTIAWRRHDLAEGGQGGGVLLHVGVVYR